MKSSSLHLTNIAFSYFLKKWPRSFTLSNCNHNYRKHCIRFIPFVWTHMYYICLISGLSSNCKRKTLQCASRLKYAIEQLICEGFWKYVYWIIFWKIKQGIQFWTHTSCLLPLLIDPLSGKLKINLNTILKIE